MDWPRKIAKVVLPLLFWGTVWSLLALRVDQPLLLPTPWAVAARLWELGSTAEFWLTAGMTLVRVFAGGAVGVALGTLTAALSAKWFLADCLTAPVVKVIRATPVASFIILVWLWSPTAWVPAVVAALMALPVAWGSVGQAIAATDPQLLELCRVYRFDRWKTLRLCYIPSVRPGFAAGCRTALGLAWKAGVAAEALCLPRRAIGTQVYYSKLYLETPDLFAWTALVIVLSFLVERGLGMLLERGAGRGRP